MLRFKLTIILYSILSVSCSKAQNVNKVEFVKSFYVEYKNELLKDRTSSIFTLKEIQNKYCSQSLMEELKSEDLHYDPFLYSQDPSPNSLNTLKVHEHPSINNGIMVTYIDEYSQDTIIIELEVTKMNGEWKINSIR